MLKQMIVLTTVFVFAAVFSVMPGVAQERSVDKHSIAIDRVVLREMTERVIPGFSVIVQKQGKTVYEKHAGYSNIELGSKVNQRTAFSIASMSKIYTAVAIHMLAEQGRLSLDDSVRKYLNDAPAAWQAITIQHLINHQSGLDDDWGFHDDWENTYKSIFANAKSNQDFLDVHYKMPLLFEPGTSLKYAAGTFVLGVVIEKVTGKSYARFMHDDVFEPVGLKETWVDDPLAVIPQRASGYLYENEKLSNGHSLSPVTLARGDVGIRASARDIAKFLAAVHAGKLVKNPAKLFEYGRYKNDSLTTRSNGGWFTWFVRGTETRDHGGNYRSGYSSVMIEFVEDETSIIILTNSGDQSLLGTAQKIASVFDSVYGEIREMPLDKREVDTDPYLKALQAISERKHDKSVLHERFPIGMYEHLGDSFKEIKQVEYLSRRDMTAKKRLIFGVPLQEIVFVRMNGEKYTGIYLAADGKVLFVELPEK